MAEQWCASAGYWEIWGCGSPIIALWLVGNLIIAAFHFSICFDVNSKRGCWTKRSVPQFCTSSWEAELPCATLSTKVMLAPIHGLVCKISWSCDSLAVLKIYVLSLRRKSYHARLVDPRLKLHTKIILRNLKVSSVRSTLSLFIFIFFLRTHLMPLASWSRKYHKDLDDLCCYCS